MTPHRKKVLSVTLATCVGLILVLAVTAIWIAQSTWFREDVTGRIIQALTEATGGRAEIGELQFDWRHLRVEIRQFVLHGTEPADQGPLFQARSIVVELRLLSLARPRKLDFSSLDVQEPRANLIVDADGRTNIPQPTVSRTGDKNALETLVDLAIGRFTVRDGSLHVADQQIPFSAEGKNLAVQLAYETLPGQYRGHISLNPLVGQYDRNKSTDVSMNLGVILGKDRVELTNATVATANSNLEITGAIEHLESPRVTAKVAGRIDLAEMKDIFGQSFPLSVTPSSPHVIDAQVEAAMDNRQIHLTTAKLVMGRSLIDASGTFRNTKLEDGSIQFRAEFALEELARLLDPNLVARGQIELGGQARLNTLSDYHVNAALSGTAIAFRRGNMSLSNIRLSSKITADSKRIDFSPLTAQIDRGQISGKASLENFSTYSVTGNLSRLDIQQLFALATPRRVDYAGLVSGPVEITGDLKRANSVAATARLSITPRGTGVPVSGSVNADYDGPRDTVSLGNSFVALPASRIEFSGALGTNIKVHLVSRDLEDFRPALNLVTTPPATLPAKLEAGGSASIDATVSGGLSAPNIAGHLAVTQFRVEQRRFDQLSADVAATPSRIAVNNASLSRGSLIAAFQGAVGLNRWTIRPASAVSATANIQNGNLLDVLAFTGEYDLPFSGDLSLDASVSGTVGDPQGRAKFRVTNGTAYGEPVGLADGEVAYGGQKVSIPVLRIESGAAQANVNATFEHPLNKFSEGTLQVHVDTNQVALARLQRLQKQSPSVDGNVQVNLDTSLVLEPMNGNPGLRVLAVNGTLEGRGLTRQGRNLGDLTTRIQTSGSMVSFRVTSNFAGSKVDANGQTDLARNYETTATVNIQDLPIQDALAVAGRSDLAESGLLSAKGDVSGTITDPRADLDVTLTKAVLERQPVDRLEGHVSYSAMRIEVNSGLLQVGNSRVNVTGSFLHPARDFSNGDVKITVQGSQVQLAQIVSLQDLRPGIAGTLDLTLDSSAKLHPAGTSARISFSRLNARASLAGVRAAGQQFGGFAVDMQGAGSTVTANVESNLAQSSIKMSGRAELTGDYPASAKITFSGVRYANWAGLLGAVPGRTAFDALLEGSATLSGPILKPQSLTGSAELTKSEIRAVSPDKGLKDLALKNDGPVSLTVDPSGVQLKSAHWTGPSTQVSVTGNVVLQPLAFNLNIDVDADLRLLHTIRDDISSAGHVQLNAFLKGPVKEPAITGKLELKDAAFQTASMPNGISKATGVIVFAGTTATIQSLTAESGGGRLTATGSVSRAGGENAYNIGLRANRVQIRTASGASVGVNADLRLNGTDQASVLSGAVTVRNVGFNRRSDLGTILAETAEPPPAPATPSGFLSSTRLDIAIKTAPGVSFQSAYTTSLDANADLAMRGTLANPGMLGRISIASGELVFFGTKYTLDSGSISFFNPTKIDPILDLNMATSARGVQVTLNVTGPVQNMNLAYQSDPPLPFSDIVGLLAAGRTPTSDPVLLANQPAVPAQSFQQMGESAILNKVVTNPVSGQLKRVFGVTELKIDPTFTSGSELPQARLTLQQNITRQLNFTYVTNLTRADSQILRAEWALNQRWSAVATRQENGLVGIDLFYKRRIH